MTPTALFILGILVGLAAGAIGMLIVNNNREKDMEGWIKTYRAYKIECEDKNRIMMQLQLNHIMMLEIAWKASHQLISVIDIIKPELKRSGYEMYPIEHTLEDPIGCHKKLNEVLRMPEDGSLLDHGEEYREIEKKVEACKLKVDTLKEAYEKTYGEPYSYEENIK